MSFNKNCLYKHALRDIIFRDLLCYESQVSLWSAQIWSFVLLLVRHNVLNVPILLTYLKRNYEYLFDRIRYSCKLHTPVERYCINYIAETIEHHKSYLMGLFCHRYYHVLTYYSIINGDIRHTLCRKSARLMFRINHSRKWFGYVSRLSIAVLHMRDQCNGENI